MLLVFPLGSRSVIGGLFTLFLFSSVAAIAHISETLILIVDFLLGFLDTRLGCFEIVPNLALFRLYKTVRELI